MEYILDKVSAGETLPEAEAERAMHLLMTGEAEPEQIAGLLLAVRARGETLDELVAFARVMREYAVPIELADSDTIDLCGTGGDRSGTFNISTTAAFVCAGAGVPVAKHGNRSVSSACGSSEVLEAVGVKTDLGKRGVEFCLREVGMGFIFAPNFHPALKYVMPVRRKLGVRTFFNILGPICNPAGVRRQIVGAFSRPVAEMMGNILVRLEAEHIAALHSKDGLDEISISEPTEVFRFDGDGGRSTLESFFVEPETFGLERRDRSSVLGGTAADNAEILAHVLDGRDGGARDVVLINAAFALSTSGRFGSLGECLEAAVESIDGGGARRSLSRLIQASHDAPADIET
jgi:anthranilate phosphoribosyltransferase